MNFQPGSSRVALVTGASSGIGQATAVELARRGFQVAIHYHQNEKGARETLEKIRTLDNGRARVYACDLVDPAQVNEMAESILKDFGRFDALVNNAGSVVERKLLAEISYDLWRKIIATNLDSVFLATQAFLPPMLQQKCGAIVNVASIAGRRVRGLGAAPYSAAKAAVISLSKGMAKEFISHGIRVNCVSPGFVATPFHNKFTSDETLRKTLEMIPLGRLGTSEEVAKVIAFLLSKEASYIVGECVEVNGGLMMS